MSQWSTVRIAVVFALLGAALMGVVLGGAWVGYQLWSGGQGRAEATVASAKDAAALAVPEQPAAAPKAEPASRAVVPPAPEPLAQARPAAPAAQGDEPAQSEAQSASPDEAKVAAAREAQAREKAHQEELAYMEKKFDERKAQWMTIIDAYLALPAEERQDYLRKAMEELRQADEAERQTLGLPARPRNQPAVFREMMGMMRDRLTEDEKKKVGTFMADVMQNQVARMQAEIERQLRTPPATGAPEPPAPNP